MAGSPFAARRLRRIIATVILASVLGVAEAVVPALGQPDWTELPANKKQILAPLAGEWDALEPWRKKKWLDIAEKYPAMGVEEQARIQHRMKAWVKLTPEERKAAREKYQNVQKASSEEREALKKMWTEYQALPEDQRQRFKQSAASKPAQAKAGYAAGAPGQASAVPKQGSGVGGAPSPQ